MSTLPKQYLRVAAALGGAALLLSSCMFPEDVQKDERSTVTSTTTAESSTPDQGVSADLPQAILDAVADVEADTGSRVSLAISSGVEQEPKFAGNLAPRQEAWSTIKVPLSIAALRQDPSLEPTMVLAITQSDNDAAMQMWDALGGGEQAAAAVEEVLAEAGVEVDVPAEKTRAQFSPFGQALFSTGQQASFAAALPTLDGAAPVLEAMGEVVAGQDYGLGTFEGARFKGGWGPDTSGAYLVRQFGLVGDTAIAIATKPADGTYESGQVVLTKIAQAIEPHLDSLDAPAGAAASSSTDPSSNNEKSETPTRQSGQEQPEPQPVQSPTPGQGQQRGPEGFSTIPAV
ncbi:hypothetical protein [Corynebacterium pelargi]|uniref:Uncharacterized protein n=1 Tax=Corynebacterium pelargi TaxID=1471400 RepID=A0A410WB25_9CORY|nr:hypothetical protein [Corynebacterium pelargi]QAU53183.1 hypothetical protein CPELA_09640 [Corynebacterium pelargi]GGG74257.1 hypothetical protein GCM10007338_09530 [Corynebacterium pelargi]